MSRFSAEEYQSKVDAGVIGASNLIDELVEQENNNEVLADALRAANTELVGLEAWRVVMDTWGREAITRADPDVVIIDRLARAVTLIKWLALPWADNEPYWPTTDTWTGRALVANAQLKESWREFVREEIIETRSTVSAGEEKDPGNNAGATT